MIGSSDLMLWRGESGDVVPGWLILRLLGPAGIPPFVVQKYPLPLQTPSDCYHFLIYWSITVNFKMSTTLHQRPPFRAEHLGSLLRPTQLLDIRHRIDKGENGLENDLKSAEDSSVRDIVKEQLDLGFHPISDGEYRRHMFW